ncbi:hypothetical protein SUDANB51_02018 [Streptomyces sp. enrichment culture]
MPRRVRLRRRARGCAPECVQGAAWSAVRPLPLALPLPLPLPLALPLPLPLPLLVPLLVLTCCSGLAYRPVGPCPYVVPGRSAYVVPGPYAHVAPGPYALTDRDQAGDVPVTRHRARYRGIGGVYGSPPSGRWIRSGSSGASGTTAPVA